MYDVSFVLKPLLHLPQSKLNSYCAVCCVLQLHDYCTFYHTGGRTDVAGSTSGGPGYFKDNFSSEILKDDMETQEEVWGSLEREKRKKNKQDIYNSAQTATNPT